MKSSFVAKEQIGFILLSYHICETFSKLIIPISLNLISWHMTHNFHYILCFLEWFHECVSMTQPGDWGTRGGLESKSVWVLSPWICRLYTEAWIRPLTSSCWVTKVLYVAVQWWILGVKYGIFGWAFQFKALSKTVWDELLRQYTVKITAVTNNLKVHK